MTDKDGGAAFPGTGWAIEKGPGGTPTGKFEEIRVPGMSLRDWFAGQAMASLLIAFGRESHVSCDAVAGEAYQYADAMLRARQDKGQQGAKGKRAD